TPEQLIRNLVLMMTKTLKSGNFSTVKGECSSLPQQGPSTQKFLDAFKT
ncbi:Ionotropic receptor 8a, partial [Hyalella azteca]